MTLLHWIWEVVLYWHLPVILAFGPLAVLELHHLGEKRRARRVRMSKERAVLRSLRSMHPGPRPIP